MGAAPWEHVRNTSRNPRLVGPGSARKNHGLPHVFCALAALAASLFPSLANAQTFAVPDPAPAIIERRPVRLDTEAEQRYLTDWRRAADPSFVAPFLRWSFGGELFFDNGETTADAFAFDVEGGVRFGLEPGRTGFTLVPTIGYGLAAGGVTSHFGSIGLGAGYEGRTYSMTYYARFVGGAVGPEAAFGIRHGAVVEMFNVLGFSVSHEVLRVDERPGVLHGIRLMGTLDLMPFFLDPEEYFDD